MFIEQVPLSLNQVFESVCLEQLSADVNAAPAFPPLRVAGLFAGIGGVELGLSRAGHEAALLCEIDDGAAEVLKSRFYNVDLARDVRDINQVHRDINLLTGGFPCQDLSQAGRAEGLLKGKQSGLVTEIFRILQRQSIENVLLENVPFMLRLKEGQAMSLLAEAFEFLGYKWAYRVVNSVAFGVPQRRERVIFLACKSRDPREVIFADWSHLRKESPNAVGVSACGFYWTEGIRGLGWAVNGIPTLKGGSTIGIPSPPAIVLPSGLVGTPDLRDAERMQGFPEDWTEPSSAVARESHRWKLLGNAVTVNVFEWIGYRLRKPSEVGASVDGVPFKRRSRWLSAGWNVGSGRFTADLSKAPVSHLPINLEHWLQYPLKPLSHRAVSGFLSRADRSSLNFPANFLDVLRAHRDKMAKAAS